MKLVNEYSGEWDVAKQVLTVPATQAPLTRTLTTRYLYDGVHRLALAAENPTNVTSPTCPDTGSAWCEKFGYDQPGNRSITWSSNISYSLRGVPGTFDANNRITGPGTGWQYNSRGLLLRNTNTPAWETFNYDLENRLRAFCTQTSDPGQCTFTTTSLAGTGKTQNYYDGEGRRVKKDEGGVITTFVYDAFGRLAAEYPGTPLTAGIRYRTTDHLGTTRVLTDGNGQVVLRQDYLAFGDTTPSTTARVNVTGYGQALDRIQFTGKERDSETGLDWFGMRYMSSAQGRFTSPDKPFADQTPHDPQSWNLYSYTRNNPLKYVDRTGEAIETAWDVLNIGLGVKSFVDNVESGNYGSAVVDAVGIVVDSAAAVVPFVPGGAGAVIKGARLADKADDVVDGVRALSHADDAADAGRTALNLTEGTVGGLRKAGKSDAHHVIQDAAVRDLPGYASSSAPGVQLSGPASKPGTPHNATRSVQQQRGGGTYAAERRIGYKALRKAGATREQARRQIKRADEHFENLGVTGDTATRVPRDRR